MRKCTLTQGNRESKDQRASASRVHVSRFPKSPLRTSREAAHNALGWRVLASLASRQKSVDGVACVPLLSRFSPAVNAPLPLRSLSSQSLHLVEVISAVVLTK